jgi:uncharacterized protein (TIGR02246 family)
MKVSSLTPRFALLLWSLVALSDVHATALGATLTPLDPVMVEGSRSVSHATAARIIFVNQSGAAVDIYWIAYDGKRMLYRANLAAGAFWQAGTFLTHPWLVVASGTGGTIARGTGVPLAGFEALTPDGDTALITGTRGTGVPPVHAQDAPPIVTGFTRNYVSDVNSIRALVKAFADARNARDGNAAAAVYSEDGEWLSEDGHPVRGRPLLASLWGSVTGQVQRTISSIDFPSDNLAVVRVETQYDDSRGRHLEAFVFVKNDGKWSIRVHQSIP